MLSSNLPRADAKVEDDGGFARSNTGGCKCDNVCHGSRALNPVRCP
jgi:hypothetical protein